MPLFPYRCQQGHESDWWGKYDAKPLTILCACGEPAAPSIALPARGLVRGGTDGGKGETRENRTGFVEESPGVWTKGKGLDLTVYPWVCTCGAKGYADAATPTECPKCEGGTVTAREIEWGKSWWDAQGFGSTGYFDRGAGRWFTSMAERRAWADANNMVEVSGVADDTDAIVRKESERNAALDEFWREQLRENAMDPEYQAMKARGIPTGDEWIADSVGYTGD